MPKTSNNKEKSRVVSITIQQELFDKIEEERNTLKMTRSRFYREALLRSIKNEKAE